MSILHTANAKVKEISPVGLCIYCPKKGKGEIRISSIRPKRFAIRITKNRLVM
jgi:hypothetical protein